MRKVIHKVEKEDALATDLSNSSLLIPSAHLNTVCKIGHGNRTCKYIGLVPSGFICVKHTDMKQMLDERFAKDESKPQGDNCEGFKPSTE